ncbi:MAG: hypothetical protein NTZ69_15795 [Bacteroidia bacterium]|nr:hypothetical protein [Bacteroidia bacterium]
MSVKERLKKFAKSQERSVRAFEIKSGLNIGYVNAIRVSIQPDKIQSIASHYPNLNTGWLLTGEGDMEKSSFIQSNNCTGCEELNKKVSELEKEKADLTSQLKDQLLFTQKLLLEKSAHPRVTVKRNTG